MEKLKPTNKREKTKKIMCIVLVVVAVLALGGLGGYAIGQMNKENEVANAREEAEKKHAETERKKQDEPKNERPAHELTPPKTTTELTCNADELSLSVAPSSDGASAGAMHYEVVLENTSGRICTLGGYPGVSLVNENGNQIGEPADRVEGAEEATVTLNPGARTQAAITMPNADNFPAGECKEGATKLRVYPPNDTGYLSVATDITTWCQGFNVAPVVMVE